MKKGFCYSNTVSNIKVVSGSQQIIVIEVLSPTYHLEANSPINVPFLSAKSPESNPERSRAADWCASSKQLTEDC
jgi:hypothetical protein